MVVVVVVVVVVIGLEVLVMWVWGYHFGMHRSDPNSVSSRHALEFHMNSHSYFHYARARFRLLVWAHSVLAPLAHNNLPKDHEIHGHAAHIAVVVVVADADADAGDSSCPYRYDIQHGSTDALCLGKGTGL